eukprot:scaffold5514_cov166-Ochromonas_danica.AAC.4
MAFKANFAAQQTFQCRLRYQTDMHCVMMEVLADCVHASEEHRPLTGNDRSHSPSEDPVGISYGK